MRPRRGRGVPIGAGRGRQPVNAGVQEEMRQLGDRLEAMDAIQRINPNADDICEEWESSEEKPEEIQITEETKVLRMLVKANGRLKVEVPMYEGNLNVEELMDG